MFLLFLITIFCARLHFEILSKRRCAFNAQFNRKNALKRKVILNVEICRKIKGKNVKFVERIILFILSVVKSCCFSES